MLSIKEVEQITGITKQNIRYYERQGLICPKRNEENDYREYSEKEVRILKIIKLFRKLDMPIEEIRKLLDDDIKLQEALNMQKERLEKEKRRLTDALNFCSKINEQELESLDINNYLSKMEEEERMGAVFANWVDDFKKVAQAEHVREFRFMPDNMCTTPPEFTESLLQYAKENNVDLVITKEGMYPEFTIDGVEYMADRFGTRFGMEVRCQMKHPEDVMPEGISPKRYRFMKNALKLLIPVIIAVVFVLSRMEKAEDLIFLVPASVALVAVFMTLFGYFTNLKN